MWGALCIFGWRRGIFDDAKSDAISGEGFRRSDAFGRQNERAGGQAFERHEITGLRYFDVVDNAILIVEINQVKRRVGSRDGKAMEASNPVSCSGGRSESLHQDFKDFDRLID